MIETVRHPTLPEFNYRVGIDPAVGLSRPEFERRRARERWLAGRTIGNRVLVVGIGTRELIDDLARAGAEVVAIDQSDHFVAACERDDERPNVSYLAAPTIPAECCNAGFDTVVLNGALDGRHHPDLLLRAARSAVKSSGIVTTVSRLGHSVDTLPPRLLRTAPREAAKTRTVEIQDEPGFGPSPDELAALLGNHFDLDDACIIGYPGDTLTIHIDVGMVLSPPEGDPDGEHIRRSLAAIAAAASQRLLSAIRAIDERQADVDAQIADLRRAGRVSRTRIATRSRTIDTTTSVVGRRSQERIRLRGEKDAAGRSPALHRSRDAALRLAAAEQAFLVAVGPDLGIEAERRALMRGLGVVGGLAGRLAVAESELEQVRFRLERMRRRRGFRLATALADDVRSWRRWRRLPVDLIRALRRRPAPQQPKRRHTAKEYLPQAMTIPAVEAPAGPMRYPHLRIAYWGRFETFSRIAPHLLIDSIDLDEEFEIGFDFVLIEPSMVNDAIPEPVTAALTTAKQADIPTVMFLRSSSHLDLPCVADITVFITEDPALGRLATQRYPDRDVTCLAPSIDPAVFNPIRWQPNPANGIAVVTAAKLDDETADLVKSRNDTTVYAPAGTSIKATTPLPDTPQQLAALYKTHLAAVVSPHLTPSTAAYQQHALELAATGTPIITTNPTGLQGLLGANHYLKATNPTELDTAITQLQQTLTRERLSIRTRRHVLLHHTRLQRLEQLLTHLNIPTRTCDRISILLATNRPDFIEHAIENVTKQTHPNKELVLILHGNHFDPATITRHTTGLPYPTTTLTCPPTWTLGDCLNHGLDHATGTYITKMDDDDYYGPHHLTDTLLAHTYTNAHITGKQAAGVYLASLDQTVIRRAGLPEQPTRHVAGGTMTLSRDALQRLRYLRRNSRIDTTLYQRVVPGHQLIYGTHSLGYILHRHEFGHTWEIDHNAFLDVADHLLPGVDAGYLDPDDRDTDARRSHATDA